MRAYSRSLMLLIAFLSLNSCNSSKNTSSSGQLPLTVTATIASTAKAGAVENGVKADGSNKVTITVSGATQGPITVTTTNGTFEGGASQISIDGTSGSVDITTCDARKDKTCAGAVTVTAISANMSMGTVNLKFIGYETVCNDGKDDNGDSRIDCADPDCNLLACVLNGTVGTCQSSACVLPVCNATGAEVCNNNVDDDCNSKTDCQESSCDGLNCKTGYDTYICKSGACTDVSSGFGLKVESKRARLPADGKAKTTVTITLTSQGVAQANAGLTLSTTLGEFVVDQTTAAPTILVSTGSDGTATATFRASATAGTATVTATLNAVKQVNLSTLITMPALGSIQIGAIQNPVMGVKYSGWNEQNQISVLLLDSEQKPYPDGLDVRFEHQQLGGSTISTPWTDRTDDTGSCLQADKCLGYWGQTKSPSDQPDTLGMAYVNLYSGTAAGLVVIKVTATAGEITRNYTIQNIAIVGAKVSGAHISLECTPKNIPVLIGDHDCINTFYAGSWKQIHCTAYFADRFNNVLGRSILATFHSEAGAAGPPAYTAQYDPKETDDQTSSLGFATDTVAITGYKLPDDVDPIDDETRYEPRVPTNECGATTHNPRDGLVSIIVMAKGEEGFVDLNGNGVRDEGEYFIDQGEPFVDANDDGQYQPGEYFEDINGDKQWNGPNGNWDADTTVWTETRVLYTGFPAFGGSFSKVDSDAVSVKSSANDQTATTEPVYFYFVDKNLNPLSPIASSYKVSSEYDYSTPKLIYSPTSVDNLGMDFSQWYCNENPATLSTKCSSACKSSPCYRVPTIEAYGGRYYNGKVGITGGSTESVVDIVDIIPTVDSITAVPGLPVVVYVDLPLP